MGCDSLVALGPATADGATLFAKNSDRPPRECQRIVQLPRRHHAPGARVRCQYVEVSQAVETAAVLGSQPWWLWGLEHGVNEHRVAIGNQTVFTREPLGSRGLLGMDLVRLGLERGRSAGEALDAIVQLLELHGQGGSGQAHVEWPYHNAFLVADPHEAWVLETSDRHWVARRVRETGHVTNGLALGADWEQGADDVTAFAVARGWWPADAGCVDFAAAYRDDAGVPPNLCTERRRRAATLLAARRGRLTPAAIRELLRDHSADGPAYERLGFENPRFFTLCMHADPLDNTTAAMVARLSPDPTAVDAAWVCLGSPCVSVFVPCYLGASLPAALSTGANEPARDSAWWRMRELLTLVERDPGRLLPVVRARWESFETALADRAATAEAEASRCAERAPLLLGEFMAHTVDAWLAEADALVREVACA